MIDRYTRPSMSALFTKEHRFRTWLDVELAATDAWSILGVVPKADACAMRRNAKFSVERIEEIERSTRHDVVAFTRCVAESLGSESKFLHFGLTSTDVVDTALSSVLNQACGIILEDIDRLSAILKS
ncbi:MAG: adenylosuccinate lyase, partial [Oscillospiraceae bacterium]|nr:adenylosuccinate lyase [Oscillospiraceae bacterium]